MLSRSAALALVVLPALLGAQDRRTVSEPALPPTCATVSAVLAPVADTTLAEADERRLDTRRIQRALDGCEKGHAVVLAANGATRAFLSGPLVLREGVTLVLGKGAVLFGSRDPRVYDVTPGSCGVLAKSGRGCRALVTAEGVAHAGLMGDGTIDGRGWATLLGGTASWWELAQQAKNTPLSQNCPRLVQLTRANEFTLYRITLRNSPNFHVVFDRGSGLTAWGVIIRTPEHARNTDGIDPMSATDVTIAHSFISTGDDDVAIKAGNGPTTHVSILHNHFYTGHGVSIGSETNSGASAILVRDLTIDGADNGLRIKSNASRGGLVRQVLYEDVCIRDTKNAIEMDTHYSASAETTGTLVPQFRDVVLRDVQVDGKARVILEGYDAARPLGITFDGVRFGDPKQIKVRASHTALVLGPGGTNLAVAGEGVAVTGSANAAPVQKSCADRFVPMPVR